MVSIESLLQRVQQAETETDRQWILLELQMSQMPSELVSMLWAAAIPHFFDLNILKALRPELTEQAENLYESLKSLTFVEEFPDGKYNIHEITRNVLLKRLWQNNQEEFRELSQRAADYFFEAGKSSLVEVEFCYHEIINEDHQQKGRLIDLVTDWWTYFKIDRLRLLVESLLELEDTKRLSVFSQGFLLHLRALLARFAVDHEKAEFFLLQAQSLYESIEIKNPRYTITLLRDISGNKGDMGNYKDAVAFCEKALQIGEEKLGSDDIDTAISLSNLAGLYYSQGRYKEAEPLNLQSLQIVQKKLGKSHHYTAMILNNLGENYRVQERYKEAEPLLLQSLQIRREKLGESHPTTGTSLNNLALLYQSQEKYKKAEPLHLQGLRISQKHLGENHPNTATSLSNLALLYQSQRRHQEAELLYIQSLQIRREQLGENHPDTLGSLNNLSRLYQSQEKYKEAIPLLECWKKIKQERGETRNTYYADRIASLGKAYEKCQRFDEAVTTYEEAISIFERVLSAKNPRTLVLKGELKRLKKKIIKKQQKH